MRMFVSPVVIFFMAVLHVLTTVVSVVVTNVLMACI